MNPALALPQSRASSRDRWVVWAAATLAVVFFAVVSGPVLPYARSHDFPQFYFAPQMVRDGHAPQLYDRDLQFDFQRRVAPEAPVLTAYVRPAFYAVLLAPLSWLPFQAAFVAFLAGQLALLGALWWWAYRRFGPHSLIFCSLFIPAGFGLINSQDCVAILAIVTAGWLAFERRRETLAGGILALALIKFHLLLLLVPAMAIRKRWKMLAAYAGAACLEAAVSIAMLRAQGVRQYLALLTSKDLATLSPSPERMLNVHAILENLGIAAPWTSAIAVCAVLVVAWYGVREAREDWQWFWISVLASLLVAPHVYEYDAALLLPAMLMCVSEPGGGRSVERLRLAAATAALPIPYLCTLIGRPWSIAPALALTVWFGVLVAFASRPADGVIRCRPVAVTQ